MQSTPCPASPQLLECWEQLSETDILCLGLTLPSYSQRLEKNLERIVSIGERQKGQNFRNSDDKLRHLLGRAVLRQTLALPDAEIPLNPWGRPELADAGAHVSISHSGEELWVALSKSTSVGIDVEKETIRDVSELARNFHPEEAAAILSLPTEEAIMAFYRCWTRKEAVLKVLGTGLSFPLTEFKVAVDDRPADWLLQPPGPPGQKWTAADLPVRPGHRGAIAARSADQVAKVLRVAPHPDGHFVLYQS